MTWPESVVIRFIGVIRVERSLTLIMSNDATHLGGN